jgi:hypothetical protein
MGIAQITVDDGVWEEIQFQKYRSFVLKLDQFNRKLGGCPAQGFDLSDCKSGLGTFDAGRWKEIRRDAAEVFMLKQ